MKYIWLTVFWAIVGVGVLAVEALSEDRGFIYGTILMDDGEELQGRIRWDKNEGSWDDILHANKKLKKYGTRSKRAKRYKVEIFGLEIYDEGGSWGGSAQSGIRFGHIAKIEPRSRSRATVFLKNGEKVKLESGADLGSSIRELLIDDIEEGVYELDWGDIEEIRFHAPDPAYTPSREFAGERLYGEVETETGINFEGFIQWDVDEIWTTDILDGDQRNRSRKIPFLRIQKIEKLSSRASEITLANGSEMRLDGSNDVNSENRGIVVIVPNWGRVKIDWDEFVSLTFKPAPASMIRKYDDFEIPGPMHGVVRTEMGDDYTGNIVWDADEEFSWEYLDGEYRDMEFDIEFAHIKKVERRSSRASEITLRNGDQFRLRGSNDVDDDNKGIIIMTDDGDEVFIDWEDFEEAEFD